MTVLCIERINNIFLLMKPSLESAMEHYVALHSKLMRLYRQCRMLYNAMEHYIALHSEHMRLYRQYRMLYNAMESKNHAMTL
jgi:hypothetical protein